MEANLSKQLRVFGDLKPRAKAKRCPKCNGLAIEIMDIRTVTPTGIYRCLNGDCPVDSFDPTMKEALKDLSTLSFADIRHAKNAGLL